MPDIIESPPQPNQGEMPDADAAVPCQVTMTYKTIEMVSRPKDPWRHAVEKAGGRFATEDELDQAGF